jgi:hypothetical protein
MRLKRIALDPVESKDGSATRRGKPGPGSILHRTTVDPEWRRDCSASEAANLSNTSNGKLHSGVEPAAISIVANSGGRPVRLQFKRTNAGKDQLC